MFIIQLLLCIHTNDFFLSHPVGFVQRYHHKWVSKHIHVSFSQEVIHLSVNFSCGLLLIGPLILPSHPFSQIVHNFRQTDGFPRHVLIAAAYIGFVIRSCTFPTIEPSLVLHVFRIFYGLVLCPASEWTGTSALLTTRPHTGYSHWATHTR